MVSTARLGTELLLPVAERRVRTLTATGATPRIPSLRATNAGALALLGAARQYRGGRRTCQPSLAVAASAR